MTAKKTKERDAAKVDPRFVSVVQAFAQDHHVSQGTRKGFGAGTLMVNGKIFAMMSSRDKFVVKLPKDRVDELIVSGEGVRFEPNRGRPMKEWLVVGSDTAKWVGLAKEARGFVMRG